MTQNELDKILKLHEKWLNGEKGGYRADLSYIDLNNAYLSNTKLIGVNLNNANLSGANLSHADLSNANLSNVNLNNADLNNANLTYTFLINTNLNGANLRHANLISAILNNANLSGANLSHADLSNANLSYAILNNADLSNANLTYTSLINTKLTYANLRYTDLYRINLYGAILDGADLRHANLNGANLNNAKLKGVYADETTAFFHLQCPEEGSYIAYKKCQDDRIVKLFIPEDAKRSSATSRKCRANKAKVLSITNIDGTENFEETISCYNPGFIYKVGETVEVKDFDENRWNECSVGIHHFITRKEAVDYNF